MKHTCISVRGNPTFCGQRWRAEQFRQLSTGCACGSEAARLKLRLSPFATEPRPTASWTAGASDRDRRDWLRRRPAATRPQQPSVYGRFPELQLAGICRLYIFPFLRRAHVTENMNGINLGVVYYPGGKWIRGRRRVRRRVGNNY